MDGDGWVGGWIGAWWDKWIDGSVAPLITDAWLDGWMAAATPALSAQSGKASSVSLCAPMQQFSHTLKNAGGILLCGPTWWSWTAAGPPLGRRWTPSIGCLLWSWAGCGPEHAAPSSGGQRGVSKCIDKDGGTHTHTARVVNGGVNRFEEKMWEPSGGQRDACSFQVSTDGFSSILGGNVLASN